MKPGISGPWSDGEAASEVEALNCGELQPLLRCAEESSLEMLKYQERRGGTPG